MHSSKLKFCSDKVNL